MNTEELKLKAENYLQLEKNEHFRKEVADLLKAEDWEDLNDRFFMDLSFGTGGLRARYRRRIKPDESLYCYQSYSGTGGICCKKCPGSG